MLIDLRYHLGSLVAVFLALGIGILIGYSLFGKEGLLEKQQQQLVDELEVRFMRLKDEREQLEANLARLAQELEQDRNLIRSIQPLLIGERLSGKDILLVVTGTAVEEDCTTEATAGPSDAGARIAGVIHPPQGEEAKAIVASALDEPQAGGEADHRPIDGVVLIGGALEGEAAFQKIDRPIIEGLLRRQIFVVGAEPVGVPVSYAQEYRRMSIPMVENIDTPVGLISLVFLLAAGNGQQASAGTEVR